jgi:peptide/nickel transport system substrate-binding protein
MNLSLAKLRGLKTLAVATAGLTLALACGNTTGGTTGGGGTPKTGGTLIAASWQEQDSMLAIGITDSATHAYAYEAPMVEGLLGLTSSADIPKNATLKDYFQPQLATEVPTTDNGDVKVTGDTMSVTYKLRHGVKWHDGQAFTSKDVVDTANFFYLKFKDNNPTPLLSTSGWDQISSVTASDDFTAVVNYKSIFGPYLTLFSGPEGVLPSHLLQTTWAAGGDMTKAKIAIDNTPANSGAFKGNDSWDKWLMGTGPFVFKEWVSGDHLTMVRNNNYWGPHKAYLDAITVKFEPDTNTELADLRTDTISLGLDFRAALLSPLSHLANVTTVVLGDSGAEKLDFNLHNKYLSDVTIRKAINMGINKQQIVDTLLAGKSVVSPDTAICLGLAAWCYDKEAMPTTKYDPAAAKKMLDDAGYKVQTSGADKGFRTFKDGTTISVNLVTTSGNALREQQEVQIASDLKGIGIQVITPFKNPTAGKLFGAYASGGVLYNHTFDIAQYTNTVSAGEPDAWYSGYVSDQIPTAENGGVGQNDTFESNPAVDAGFKAGRSKVSQADRKAGYVAAGKALAADLPEAPLYQQLSVNAYSNKLGGYKANADYWFNNSADWFLNT